MKRQGAPGARGLKFLYSLVVREQKRVHLGLLTLVQQVPRASGDARPAFVTHRIVSAVGRCGTVSFGHCPGCSISRNWLAKGQLATSIACKYYRFAQHVTAQADSNAMELVGQNGHLQLAFQAAHEILEVRIPILKLCRVREPVTQRQSSVPKAQAHAHAPT